MHTKHYSLLGIPSTEQVKLAVIVGYGDEQPPVHERRIDNVKYVE